MLAKYGSGTERIGKLRKKPVFYKESLQIGNLLSLGTLWASKVVKGNEDGTPQKLKYEKSTFIPD